MSTISYTEILSTSLILNDQRVFSYRVQRPENILYRTKEPQSDIVIADFGMCVLSFVYFIP